MIRSIVFHGSLLCVLLSAMVFPAVAEKIEQPGVTMAAPVDSVSVANELRAVRISPGQAVIETNGKTDNFKYFTLQEPARLVVDVFGLEPLFKERRFPADDGFEQVRLGTYSDKTRLVFDATESVLPKHKVEEHATGILVSWVVADTAEQVTTVPAGQSAPANNQAVTPVAATAVQTVGSAAVDTLPEPPESPEKVAKDTGSFSGIKMGSLRLLPELTVSGVYDDNIFATRTETKSDHILHMIPSLELTSHWSKHAFGLNLGADIARYDKYSNENFEDYWVSADGRYDFAEPFNLFGGISYSREHEERGSPDDQNGTEPTIFYSQAAHLGSEIKTGKLTFRFGGTYEELDFDDVDTSTGLKINNDDRDRNLIGAGVRISYDWSEALQPFAQYIYDDREYDSQVDDNGYRRDSDGYELAAGLKYAMKPGLTAELYAGTLHQEYADDRFSTVSKPDFGAQVTWLPSPAARINGVIERSIEETTIIGSSGYLETRYALNIGYNLTRNTIFRSHLQFSEDDYQEISRKDKYFEAGFGLQYDLTKNLFLGADYSFSHRNSNIDDSSNPDSNDYYRHQLMVSLGTRLYPVKDDPLKGFTEALSELYTADSPPSGFYLGGLFSYGAMATKASEERLHGGSSQADFGADGIAGGVFSGYSITHERWVYGLEVEAEDSSLEWDHKKNKTESRTFSVKQNEGLGASARLGYTMLDGSILYGRVGFIKTRFETSYKMNELPQDDYSETQTLTGLRLGLGLDVPLTEQWFWRMETTYTDYESYHVDSVLFDEKFEPEAHFFSFGLGWRFDAPAKPTAETIIEDLNGAYAGVQIGYGTLATEVEGFHTDGGGSETGPFEYSSDFADQGLNSGLFVGYGKMFDRVYVGVELEAEVNDMEWFRERQTSGGGRNFSVEVKEGYGASARLGYQFRKGTLAYVRAGIISSKVITRYAKGGNRDNDVYRDDYLDGTRFGLGFETPITSSVAARLEYTHTDYDDYDMVTAHTNSDQLNFEHSLDLVRLGILFRF